MKICFHIGSVKAIYCITKNSKSMYSIEEFKTAIIVCLGGGGLGISD